MLSAEILRWPRSIPRSLCSGSASATFVIQVIDDDRYREAWYDHQRECATFASGQAVLLVTDNDPNYPWTNLQLPEDVNASGSVTPLDALLLITRSILQLGQTARGSSRGKRTATLLRLSRDGFLTPIDA